MQIVDAPPQRPSRNILVRSLSLAISGLLVLGCVAFIYQQGNWREIGAILQRFDPKWVVAALVFYWLQFPVNSYRFQRIILWITEPALAIPLGLIFKLSCSAGFVAVAAPMGLVGEVAKIAALRALGHLSITDATRCTLFDRAAAAQFMAVLGLAAIPAQYLSGLPLHLLGIEFLFFAGTLVGIGILVILPRALRLIRISFVDRIAGMFVGYTRLLGSRRVAVQLFICFLDMVLVWTMLECLVAAAGLTANPWLIAGFIPFLQLINSIPFLYLGWGGREIAMVATLGSVSSLSVNETLALSAAWGVVIMVAAVLNGVFILGDWQSHRRTA